MLVEEILEEHFDEWHALLQRLPHGTHAEGLGWKERLHDTLGPLLADATAHRNVVLNAALIGFLVRRHCPDTVVAKPLLTQGTPVRARMAPKRKQIPLDRLLDLGVKREVRMRRRQRHWAFY